MSQILFINELLKPIYNTRVLKYIKGKTYLLNCTKRVRAYTFGAFLDGNNILILALSKKFLQILNMDFGNTTYQR